MVEQNNSTLIEALRKTHGSERRAFVRQICNWTVSCYSVLPADDNRTAATICDISPGGLRLVACRAFKEGEIIAIELTRPVDGVREKIFGRVQHVAGQGGVWFAGCRFVCRMSHQAVEALSTA